MDKKAISPLITTILLILLAIVLASIIFLWAKGFVKEQVSKFIGGEDRPIEEACANTKIQASLMGSSISITNLGSIYVYKLGVRIDGKFSSSKIDLSPGASGSVTLDSAPSSLEIIPILLGKGNQDAIKEYTCPNPYWQTIS